MHDLIIIGGGPAALAAAFYALDKQLAVVVLADQLGGKVGRRESVVHMDEGEQASSTRRYLMREGEVVLELMPPIPAHRLVRVLAGTVQHAGCMIDERAVYVAHGPAGFVVSMETGSTLQARTVLVATGATPRRLAGADDERLRYAAIHYSMTTYSQQVAGQRVAVVGSTERAVLGVAELLRSAAQVTFVVPDSACLDTPLAQSIAQHPRLEILANAEVRAVRGSRALEALEVAVDGNARRIPCERAFVDLGLVPNSGFIGELAERDEQGFVVVDRHNMTATPGLFAAGDVTQVGDEQVLAAIGDGARAAKSAYAYLITASYVGEPAVPQGPV